MKKKNYDFSALKLITLDEKKVRGKLSFVRRIGNKWSKWWENFEEIFDGDSKEDFVRCTLCKGYEYKPGTNTNSIIRHKCRTNTTTNLRITPEIKSKLYMGSACFIAKDLRPYKAIECEGLLDLCTACIEFGKKYRNATRKDLESAMPSRNTVQSTVSKIAQSNRKKVKDMILKAIETGGIAATTDCWQQGRNQLRKFKGAQKLWGLAKKKQF